MEQEISKISKKIRKIGKEKVRFIILYGSIVKSKNTSLSDIDFAVFFKGDKVERFNFRKRILGRVRDKCDIQIFQDLPLYIRKDIITNGKVLFFADYKEIFEIYYKTIKEFENFKPRLELY
ncbi:MAG: type VII toxin-antitoxin system MntA family adenylyltransferase antitoxin, partial [Candidatus Helarchaeota archaeon]